MYIVLCRFFATASDQDTMCHPHELNYLRYKKFQDHYQHGKGPRGRSYPSIMYIYYPGIYFQKLLRLLFLSPAIEQKTLVILDWVLSLQPKNMQLCI